MKKKKIHTLEINVIIIIIILIYIVTDQKNNPLFSIHLCFLFNNNLNAVLNYLVSYVPALIINASIDSFP